jgi:hypothetical protein
MIKVKARLSDGGGPDVVVNVGKTESVRMLVRRLLEESAVSSSFIFFLTISCLPHMFLNPTILPSPIPLSAFSP